MGSKLKENLSNKYFQRRNLLNARPNLVKVLVEDGSDISIWERILKAALPNKQFDVKTYQEGLNRAQSKQLVIKTIREKGGSLYIGCVDSDLDKLLESEKYSNEGLFYPSHYLFHTYVYSVENLFCEPSTLGDTYRTVTSFPSGLDYETFFKMVSQRIYPLVVTDLYLRSVDSKQVFNVDNWAYIFPGVKVIKQTLSGKTKSDIVQSIENNVTKYLKSFQQASAYSEVGFREYCKRLAIEFPYMTEDNCILFVYGHEVFNFVMKIFEEQRLADVEREKKTIFAAQGMSQQVKTESIAALKNRQYDILTALRSNFSFMVSGCFAYSMIAHDLQRAL